MGRQDFKRRIDPDPKDAATKEYIRKLEEENEKLKSQVGTDQTLFECIKENLQAWEPPEVVKYGKPKLSHADLHAVLIVTDAHAEESVLWEEMEGLSEYNWPIFQERMLDKLPNKTLELVNIMRQASRIDCLDVWSLGDWFCGKIQPQEESFGVTMPMPMAVPKVGITFGQFLAGLSAHFKKVRVTGLCGNHGREGKKPVLKMTADRNWDMAVYLIAQELTKNCANIEWHLPRSIMEIVEIMGWNCLLTHSGEVNMNNRVPYYPIESTFDMEHKVRAGTGKDFNYVFTGHWHHHAVLDSSIILCPSMIGSNQFSRFKLHRRSKPEQLLGFFTEKHGLVTQWPIML
jgi:hypothetical protein